MTRWTTVVATGSARADDVEAWLRAVGSDGRGHASRVLDDKAGEGDVVWSRTAEVAAAETAPGLRITEDVRVDPIASRVVPFEGDRYLRTLLLRVQEGTDPARVELLEASLVAMPDHIASIRSWGLSRLDRSDTTAGWTHLWEQEFEEPRGFRPYMSHPYHWTAVERWFDPEVPGRIVDAEAHYMSPVPGAVITEQEED